MPTPGGTSRKPTIVVTLGKNGNTYEAVGRNVDLIGEKRGNHIRWEFKNTLPETLEVTVRNFSGTSCPVDLAGCAATVQVGPLGRRHIRAKLRSTASPGRYTYAVHVHNPQTGLGNDIDPELQIDDMHGFHDLLKSPIMIGGMLAVLAALAWWFFG